MNKKILFLILVLASVFVLVGCKKDAPLTIWVGTESVEFYEGVIEDYLAAYETANGEAFPHEILVKGADTGSAAATFLEDTEAGPDIFTVAHDNLGKLIAGSSSIAPVTDADLLAQIENDNPDSFKEVIKGVVGGQTYTFGVPYIAQSLVLYYNKEFITTEQVQTWEGILAAAEAANKQALSLTGTDGFNNSFLLLATNAETGQSSLKLYYGGDINNNFASGDDTVSVMKWGQRFFTHENGPKRPTDSGWQIELKDEISLSVISGAWHYNAASAALGSKLGIVKLPTFTITEADAYGSVTAGTVFQSGTFADTKMFVMKKGSKYQEFLQDIVKYLSSKDVQEASYEEVQNLPAYKNAAVEFESMTGNTLEAQLASAQIEMFEHGIPQPFGFDNRFNFYYYSKGAPDLILEILENKSGTETGLFTSFDQIKAQLLIIENIWKTGNKE
ncbi:MAG: hypothetical protein A2Y45_03490 [Tenericutes bacterium GWC2_34_14]|nr:MAG: hypothetical protein A2Y45_03490 [Tenericutes bacterium GWC2_34_14]OHE34280.1 MAG: hypothetical protein A2012_09080 [Tenericutes bacterium GWE2_34_108]OHE35632.1 MAG: hypothetical protein A2Y46_05845 [Tenericutes bacterium GWF1_35_14]OHE38847.1 MAG: hypothetical protein A2Y44_00280 [Tenericutes bacterium GWF2_35_184]OHE42535.1 MAG: hypothetical protein A3K26_07880 [Tenericutes bacterium RIFOXYA12_FULL_35_10]OHE43879.1 MAG: hypothetical protein A2221_10175 [Tenericutes bacterium RIFOXYA